MAVDHAGGVMRTGAERADYKVALKASMAQFMNMAPGEAYWAASDIGWATFLKAGRHLY